MTPADGLTSNGARQHRARARARGLVASSLRLRHHSPGDSPRGLQLSAAPPMGSYRSAAGLANQYRQELDHLNYSRNNAIRRERELERELEEERFRASQREHDLSRKLRAARNKEKHERALHATHHVARNPAAPHYHPSSVGYQAEAEKLALERKLLAENRKVLELEEEVDRQLSREQRLRRQLDSIRAAERSRQPLRPSRHDHWCYPDAKHWGGDTCAHRQANEIARLRMAVQCQQEELEHLQSLHHGGTGLVGTSSPLHPPLNSELYALENENAKLAAEVAHLRAHGHLSPHLIHHGLPPFGVHPATGAEAALAKLHSQLESQLHSIRSARKVHYEQVHGHAGWPVDLPTGVPAWNTATDQTLSQLEHSLQYQISSISGARAAHAAYLGGHYLPQSFGAHPSVPSPYGNYGHISPIHDADQFVHNLAHGLHQKSPAHQHAETAARTAEAHAAAAHAATGHPEAAAALTAARQAVAAHAAGLHAAAHAPMKAAELHAAAAHAATGHHACASAHAAASHASVAHDAAAGVPAPSPSTHPHAGLPGPPTGLKITIEPGKPGVDRYAGLQSSEMKSKGKSSGGKRMVKWVDPSGAAAGIQYQNQRLQAEVDAVKAENMRLHFERGSDAMLRV